MIAGLSKTIDALINSQKESMQELKLLKAKMTKEELKKLNAFETEINAAMKDSDFSKVTEITKKYFSNDTTK